MNQAKLPPETLDRLQCQTFDYFVYEVNPLNGLVVDKTQGDAPASIAAVGLALSAYPVGVERGFMTRGSRRTNARNPAVFPGQLPGPGSGSNGLQGLLLSLSRHEDRQARLEL